MMTLDLNSGVLIFQKCFFSPEINLNDIKSEFLQNEFELQLKNEKWETYRLNIVTEYIFRIYFFDKKISFIEICPSEINDDDQLRKILSRLGGEANYSWGKVELNNDHKAGYKSVIIKYNYPVVL